ncbi:unnamed protein product [Lasius platythorax]|uniref:Uncharacterized protein n=1 Tax=Lasius platythorax TaxID=488582 RepID=A0AAV2N0T2_9HYME
MSNGRLNEDRKRGGRRRRGARRVKGRRRRGGERRREENGFSDSEAEVSPPLTKGSRRKGSHSSGLALALAYCST